MTIQGSTDVFPPAAFLRFLAHTNRTGRYTVEHAGGTGTALLRKGRIGSASFVSAIPMTVGATPEEPKAGDLMVSSLAEILLATDGTFTFTPLGINGAGEGNDTAGLLQQAEASLDEVRERRERWPRTDDRVELVADVSFRHLRVDEVDWSIIVAVGDGTTVSSIAEQVDRPVAEVGTRLAGLAGHGVLAVTRAATTPPVADAGDASLNNG